MTAPYLLLVEDDEPIRTWLEFELSQEEYVVRTARDGIEGMFMLDHGVCPDLILLDVNLPGLSGFDMCQRIKTNPRTAAIPIIFVTARGTTEDLLVGLEAGAVEYVTKPFKIAELKARVQALLRQSERARVHLQGEVAAEIGQAADVQSSLMATGVSDIPGLEVYASWQAAKQVGGDFLHVSRRNDGRYCIAEGDVSGKGMAAALMATTMRTEMRATAQETTLPSAALADVNQHLYADLTEINRFITLFLGFYDPSTRQLTYSNAGHSLVAYLPAGEPIRILEADSPPLGVLGNYDGRDEQLTLAAGDLILIVTDGIFEAVNANGEMYGIERLLHLAGRLASRSVAELGNNLLADIDRFTGGIAPNDDRTVIVLKGKEST